MTNELKNLLSIAILFYGNQLCIEEGNASTKSDSNFNFNSNNFSAEEAQLSLKNAFDLSS